MEKSVTYPRNRANGVNSTGFFCKKIGLKYIYIYMQIYSFRSITQEAVSLANIKSWIGRGKWNTSF